MKKLIGTLCATVLLFAASLCTVFSVQAKTQDPAVIENGIYIGDVDVSGLSASEATQKVNEYLEEIGETKVSMNAMNNNSLAVSVNDIGLCWVNTDIVDKAVDVAKAGNLVERYKASKDLEHENLILPLEVSVDRGKVLTIIKTKCKQFNVSATDSTLTREDGEFKIVPGLTGVVIDEEASADAVVSFMENDWEFADASIDLIVETEEPRGSESELSEIKDLLGSFTTDYSTSGANRSGNVANGARLINGTLLYPGDEFSVYKAVSPFTTENGYFMAGSYLNGMVVDSLGGGICQVSTTLYNAVLLAELDVKERSNHSMIVTYVDPSADAAISGTKKDFKFVNNTEHPIYIEGFTENKKITFNIYGVETRPSNRKVTYESEVLSRTVPPGEKVVADGSHGVGYISVQSAHVGYTARLWKVVTVDGKEESREIVNESSYAAVPKTAAVGTATSDPNLSAAIHAAIASQSIGAVRAVLAGGAPPTAGPTPEQIAAQQAALIAQQQAEAAAAAAAQAAAGQ